MLVVDFPALFLDCFSIVCFIFDLDSDLMSVSQKNKTYLISHISLKKSKMGSNVFE